MVTSVAIPPKITNLMCWCYSYVRCLLFHLICDATQQSDVCKNLLVRIFNEKSKITSPRYFQLKNYSNTLSVFIQKSHDMYAPTYLVDARYISHEISQLSNSSKITRRSVNEHVRACCWEPRIDSVNILTGCLSSSLVIIPHQKKHTKVRESHYHAAIVSFRYIFRLHILYAFRLFLIWLYSLVS